MIKRGVLLLAVLLAALGLLALQLRLWGFDTLLPRALIITGAIGMAGALASLLFINESVKRALKIRLIDAPHNETEQWLLEAVRPLAEAADIRVPQIGIFDSLEINAFSVGQHRNHALLALSSGMLARMSPDEIKAVLAHEVAHIANGHMVTLGLLQGVLNTFVFFPAKLIDSLFTWARKPKTYQRAVGTARMAGPGPAYFIVVVVLELAIGLLAQLLVLWFSRQRQMRADHDAANLIGSRAMISALQRVRRSPSDLLPTELPPTLATFGIAGIRSGLAHVFLDNPLTLTHPPVEDRLAALRNMPSGPLNRYQCATRRGSRGTPSSCVNCNERRDCPRAP